MMRNLFAACVALSITSVAAEPKIAPIVLRSIDSNQE